MNRGEAIRASFPPSVLKQRLTPSPSAFPDSPPNHPAEAHVSRITGFLYESTSQRIPSRHPADSKLESLHQTGESTRKLAGPIVKKREKKILVTCPFKGRTGFNERGEAEGERGGRKSRSEGGGADGRKNGR